MLAQTPRADSAEAAGAFFVRFSLRFAARTIKHHGQQRGASMRCRRRFGLDQSTLLAACLEARSASRTAVVFTAKSSSVARN